MTRALGIIAGTALILLFATLLLVVMPTIQLQTGRNPPEALQPWTASELAGRDHYISLGCVYCHSQQPRDPSQAPDTARGWGRASVPSDYSYDTTHLLGTMRTGPDLFNIGARQPSVDWHLTHLYQPRAVSPGSNMPAYPFLFRDTDFLGEQIEVKIPDEYLPSQVSKYIVPTDQALELVDYLLSLDRTYPAEELPEAAPESDEASDALSKGLSDTTQVRDISR
ncbi:MAG: cbb3-type cytochrome c oxidase subunit II [Granulosicoccus sp.]|nr:cbb3-type cytochrome c oxidase subunit II [Granulosicoccus sp.]